MEITIGNISNLLTLAGMAIAWIYFASTKKKSKELDNERKSIQQWQELYLQSKEELREKDKKIDTLYEEISNRRDEEQKIKEDREKIIIENIKMKLLKCEKPNCINRKPPTGY